MSIQDIVTISNSSDLNVERSIQDIVKISNSSDLNVKMRIQDIVTMSTNSVLNVEIVWTFEFKISSQIRTIPIMKIILKAIGRQKPQWVSVSSIR
jgi:hypothetical protein